MARCSLLELEIAEGNFASAAAGARLDIIGVEADYDGPSYVADNTSLLLSARQFDFNNLFKEIGENDIGTPRLTDVIVKSVTDLNDDHRLELLGIYASEDFKRTVPTHHLRRRRSVTATMTAMYQGAAWLKPRE